MGRHRTAVSGEPADDGAAAESMHRGALKRRRARCATRSMPIRGHASDARLDRIEIADRDAAGRAERVAIEGAKRASCAARRCAKYSAPPLASNGQEHLVRRAARSRLVRVRGQRVWARRRTLPGRRAGSDPVRRKAVRRAAAVFPGNDAPHASPLRRLEPDLCRRPSFQESTFSGTRTFYNSGGLFSGSWGIVAGRPGQ